MRKTLNEYKYLKNKFGDDIEGIVTITLPDQIFFNNSFSLRDCINELEISLRRFAYSIFTKYPIDTFVENTGDNGGQYLENNYIITIDQNEYNALYPYLVSKINGVLFSLAVHTKLETNTIKIVDDNSTETLVNNLFGYEPNTTVIVNIIEGYRKAKLSNFDKLISLMGENVYSDRFKKGFEQAALSVQNSIIETFKAAIKRNGTSNFFADKVLIKDVTPSNSTYKVYELRVKSPVAFRVYFYESDNIVYLALIEKKPTKKQQTDHINVAKSIIKALVELGK